MRTQLFDRFGQEIPEPRLIWADRLPITLFLLTGGLLGLVYAAFGDPGTFVLLEKVCGIGCGLIWAACRIMDFAATGKIR